MYKISDTNLFNDNCSIPWCQETSYSKWSCTRKVTIFEFSRPFRMERAHRVLVKYMSSSFTFHSDNLIQRGKSTKQLFGFVYYLGVARDYEKNNLFVNRNSLIKTKTMIEMLTKNTLLLMVFAFYKSLLYTHKSQNFTSRYESTWDAFFPLNFLWSQIGSQ